MTTIPSASEATIRPALPEEAPLISELALRSKAYWGYDHAFMEACRPGLTFERAYFDTHPVLVVEAAGQILGFYSLVGKDTEVELDNLFVEPSAIGHGYGKGLFLHAVATARQLGYQRMLIESEPNAEAFYQALGAIRIGERPSPIRADRRLPLLRLDLVEAGS